MKDRKSPAEALVLLKSDCRIKQKRGLAFILASIPVWMAILSIQLSALPVLGKNFWTFCCSVPLIVLAFLISGLIGADFQNRDNPLSKLGLIMTFSQMPYLLIVMWVYSAVPDKMLMVYAMVFGAHLFPFGWLYDSKAYYIFSAVIPVSVLSIGLSSSSVFVALFMVFAEIIFSLCLVFENRTRKQQKETQLADLKTAINR